MDLLWLTRDEKPYLCHSESIFNGRQTAQVIKHRVPSHSTWTVEAVGARHQNKNDVKAATFGGLLRSKASVCRFSEAFGNEANVSKGETTLISKQMNFGIRTKLLEPEAPHLDIKSR